jgi:hypothetical protein
MKKVWIIIIVAVVLSGAVLAVGSLFIIYKDDGGFHVASRNAAEIYANKDANKFEEIEIKTTSSNIEFVIANRYGFEYMANAILETTYSNENGKLTITQDAKPLLFSLNFWSFKNDYVKIYLPENAKLKNVKISNVSGNITVANMTAENLDINATSGNTTINNITTAIFSLDKTSGNVKINDCNTGIMNVRLVSGGLKAENIETGSMKVNLTSGNVTLDGKLSGMNDIKSISGNVTLNLQGEKKDYNSDISVVSGNVTVDGNKTKTYEYENAEAVNSLKINSTSGNVTVNFKGQ